MITIDRDSATSISEQLITQLRFLIASGHFQAGDTLPSTRALGKQISLSFHTIRKAYQALEEEGLITSKAGRGYQVLTRTTQDTSDLIERGATTMQQTLQELVGLGLSFPDIDYIFQEQLSHLSAGRVSPKALLVDSHVEHAEMWREQLGEAISYPFLATSLAGLSQHTDAELVFTPFPLVRPTMEALPQADVYGIQVGPDEKVLARVSRLLAHQTLGLITRDVQSIPAAIGTLQQATRFPGDVLAAALEGDKSLVEHVIRESTCIAVYQSGKRRFQHVLRSVTTSPEYQFMRTEISASSLQRIISALPR